MSRPGHRSIAVLSIVLLVALLGPVGGATAGGGGGDARGSCSGGPGMWRLSVDRRDGGRLRVRFRLDDVQARRSWHVFLSNDGHRIFSATHRSDGGGDLRITKTTTNRAGRDRVAASAVQSASGVVCGGSVTV